MCDKVVCDKGAAEEADEAEAAGWVQNHTQEPHTKMWGKTEKRSLHKPCDFLCTS